MKYVPFFCSLSAAAEEVKEKSAAYSKVVKVRLFGLFGHKTQRHIL